VSLGKVFAGWGVREMSAVANLGKGIKAIILFTSPDLIPFPATSPGKQ
jgi:hypothetical protein